MKITGSQTKDVDVDIPEHTILEFAMAVVGNKANIDVEEYFLNAEKTEIRMNDPNWRHGSMSDELVRKATPEDLEAFECIRYLKWLAGRLKA